LPASPHAISIRCGRSTRANDDAVDVYREEATVLGFELGEVTHPAHQKLRPDEIVEDAFWLGLDVDLCPIDLAHFFFLDLALEGGEPWLPEALNELLHGQKARRADRVQAARALLASFHQTRSIEHGQVLRHGLLRDVDLSGDFAHRAWALAEQPQDLEAPGFTERLEHRRASQVTTCVTRAVVILHKHPLVEYR